MAIMSDCHADCAEMVKLIPYSLLGVNFYAWANTRQPAKVHQMPNLKCVCTIYSHSKDINVTDQ